MNSKQLEYFPDLKKFIFFLLKYYLLFIFLTLSFLILGFYKFNQDKNNPIINEEYFIEVTKKVNINYKFTEERYQSTSQVKTLTSYIDIHKFVFDQINDMIKNSLEMQKAVFTQNSDNLNNSTFIVKNFEVNNELPQEINNNIIKKFNNFIKNYKNIEFQKFDRKISQFLFDIAIADGSFPDVLLTDNFSSGNDENKLKFLEETFNQLIERGITQVPDKIFGDLFLRDNEYKEKFVHTIKLYLLEKCNEVNNKDLFCSYIKLNNFQTDPNKNYQNRLCELASSSMDFKRILLIILDSKTLCTEGFNISQDIIFLPLDKFLENINFYDGLFEINIYSKVDKIEPSPLLYIFYSLITAFFFFLIFSITHSFSRNFK